MRVKELIDVVDMSLIEVKGQYAEHGTYLLEAVRVLYESVELLAEAIEKGDEQDG